MEIWSLPPAMLALLAALVIPSSAQYPPPASYQNILQSSINPNITVAYKQPLNGTCTTAFTTQKQYTGYIGMPPYTLAPIQQNYSINYFFWFIEARQTPESAPLTLYINGGPGSSSMFGLFNEVGPCEVVQMQDGSYGTQYREWGWDRSTNILFLDQPNQVGFSYDSATNASFDVYGNLVFEPPTPPNSNLPSFMYLNGTFGTASSDDSVPYDATANTTEIAAQAMWHFLQAWLSAFPQYNPSIRPNSTVASTVSNVPVGINMFTESYGGKYGPAFASFCEQQNQARLDGFLPLNSTLPIELQSLGIMNGLIDDAIQDYYYPYFAYNNTYGIEIINQVQELNAISSFSAPGGCLAQIQTCQNAMNIADPEGYGDSLTTNAMCEAAQMTCNSLPSLTIPGNYYPYDIRQKYPSPDPPAAYQEYLNSPSVLSAIGARVNYTESNPYVQLGFISTGDTIRGGLVSDLAYLLSNNVRVALIYGDADFLCNWYGGQAVSFAVANSLPNYPPPLVTTPGTTAPASYMAGFPAAGYADIVVNNTYVGGAVRQYGNLSFSRIYDAGHFVPYYQPETAFTVFTRIIQGTDISMGDIIDLSNFGSTGTTNATYTNTASYSPTQTCWVRAFNQSCSSSDTAAMLVGQGVVANGIYYANSDETSSGLPTSTVPAGVPGHPLGGSSMPGGDLGTSSLTGVYTATGTPKATTSKAAADRLPAPFDFQAGPVGATIVGFVLGALVMI